MKLVQLVGAATRRQELKHQGKYRTLNTTEKYFRNTEKIKKFSASNTRLRLRLLESKCYVQRRKWRNAAQRRVRSDRRWIRWMRRLATCSNFSDFGTPRSKLRAFGTPRRRSTLSLDAPNLAGQRRRRSCCERFDPRPRFRRHPCVRERRPGFLEVPLGRARVHHVPQAQPRALEAAREERVCSPAGPQP